MVGNDASGSWQVVRKEGTGAGQEPDRRGGGGGLS